MEALLICLSGVMDRLRGDAFHIINRNVEKALYGWILAAIVGLAWSVWTPLVVALFMVGCSVGWGQPFGNYLYDQVPSIHNREVWQVGKLWDYPFLSLIVRGFIWGVPMLTLYYWKPEVAAISIGYIIGFPLSAFVIKHIKPIKSKWESTELFRGLLGASLTYGFYVLLSL